METDKDADNKRKKRQVTERDRRRNSDDRSSDGEGDEAGKSKADG